MDHKFNRYYRKIRTILDIDLKTIHVTALEPSAPSYTIVTR